MKTGDLVRLIRGKSGLSQTDFGAAIGAARPTVAQWESNKHSPRLENVVQIIEKFTPEKAIADKLLENVGRARLDIVPFNIASAKASSDPEKVTSDIVNALFDMVIAGEITFRKEADPKVTAEHIYRKLVSSGFIEPEANVISLTPEENASLNSK
jgi:DNA-binding XRE family transcriptional regulator